MCHGQRTAFENQFSPAVGFSTELSALPANPFKGDFKNTTPLESSNPS